MCGDGVWWPHVWAVGWQHIHDNVVVVRVAVRLRLKETKACVYVFRIKP